MHPIQFPKLKIGEFEAKIPIIQGGMSMGISLSGLSSAVANEGGIGVIGTAGIGMFEPDFTKNFREANTRALKSEIRKARQMTSGILGVNVLVALTDYAQLVLTSIDEGIDFVFCGAGLPLKNPELFPPNRIKEVVKKVIPIVSSGRATRIICQSWLKNYNQIPDAVVVEGPMAGGHLGFKREQIDDPDYTLEKIVPEVIEALVPFEQQMNKKVPVIAAGGIYTGEDIDKYMRMGAQGVQMATRFVGTHECDAYDGFKKAYIECKEEDITIIDSPVGMPGRAIGNQFLKNVKEGREKPPKCPWRCLKTCDFIKTPYCITMALIEAKKGCFEKGFAFAGANAWRVDKICSVKELIESLREQYQHTILKLQPLPV
ncbi:MAG: nitronate monooxygenase [Dehalococcoidales bacterium]|nr:nitronate monooxygenase [Dehalococcoidales bacterium]